MTSSARRKIEVQTVTARETMETHAIELPEYDRARLDDVAFMTAMNLCLMDNYAQTGHFGGPLAYTPYNVACHLAGPDFGGLRYDLRDPKFAYADKFMLAGGHCRWHSSITATCCFTSAIVTSSFRPRVKVRCSMS